MLRELNKALRALDLTEQDGAAVELARTYARAIDEDPDKAGRIGPQLLATLDALGMTPKSRATLAKGGASNGPASSPLDELRKRRAARQCDATPVDAAPR